MQNPFQNPFSAGQPAADPQRPGPPLQRQSLKSATVGTKDDRKKMLRERCVERLRGKRKQILDMKRRQPQETSAASGNGGGITQIIREVMDDERQRMEVSDEEYWDMYREIEEQLEREMDENHSFHLEDNERMLEMAYKRSYEHMRDEDIMAEDAMEFQEDELDAILRSHDVHSTTGQGPGNR